jgi:Dirigent-like protein
MRGARVSSIAIAVLVAVLVGPFIAAAGGAAPSREKTRVRILVTEGYYVPSGEPNGAGDLFGSSGELRQSGKRIGRFSSACQGVPSAGGQCQATLVWKGRGRLQIAGNVNTTAEQNRLAIVGGTRDFRKARGTALVRPLDEQSQRQSVRLLILR